MNLSGRPEYCDVDELFPRDGKRRLGIDSKAITVPVFQRSWGWRK